MGIIQATEDHDYKRKQNNTNKKQKQNVKRLGSGAKERPSVQKIIAMCPDNTGEGRS